MSDGKWSGGAANRHWGRQGSRLRNVPGDAERAARLFEQMKDVPFLCECGQMHALIEHRICRAAEAARPNVLPPARA